MCENREVSNYEENVGLLHAGERVLRGIQKGIWMRKRREEKIVEASESLNSVSMCAVNKDYTNGVVRAIRVRG